MSSVRTRRSGGTASTATATAVAAAAAAAACFLHHPTSSDAFVVPPSIATPTRAIPIPTRPPSSFVGSADAAACAATSTSTSTSATRLGLARGGVHGKKTRMIQSQRKKKTKAKNDNGRAKAKRAGRRGRDGRDDSLSDGGAKKQRGGGGGETKRISLPSDKTSGPPWRVMSDKDAARHVVSERKRRERIRLAGSDDASSSTATMMQQQQRGAEAVRKKADVTSSLLSDADRSLLNWKRFRPDANNLSGVAYVGSYLNQQTPPTLGVPEIAFLGRSNVGKSSLLNQLTSHVGTGGGGGGGSGGGSGGGKGSGGKGGRTRSDKARVGKTPGATAAVNLYAVLGKQTGGVNNAANNNAKPILGLADLPGFGYAKLSKTTKESVEIAAEKYLNSRRQLALGVLLVDARRIPSDDDRAVLAALYDMGVPIVVVATKIDKLNKTELDGAMERVRDGLGLPDGQPLRVSSMTGQGTKELWRIVLDACESRVGELRKEAESTTTPGEEEVLATRAATTAAGGRSGEVVDNGGAADDFYDALDDFYDDDGEEEEEELENDDEEEEFYDGEDVAYDQGYDWIHGGGGAVLYEDEAVGGRSVYDAPYGDDALDDADEWLDRSMSRRQQREAENEERQRDDREAFKLKSLRKVVRAMERRGEI